MQQMKCRVIASLTSERIMFSRNYINTNKFSLDVASSPSSEFGVLYLVISVALTFQICKLSVKTVVWDLRITFSSAALGNSSAY